MSQAAAEDVLVYDGMGDGSPGIGGEENVKDWAALKIDPNTEPLAETFTICSSVSTADMSAVDTLFWQLLTSDGSGWLYQSITSSDERAATHSIRIGAGNVLSLFNNHSLEKVPMQMFWYHGCTAIDTATGHVSAVVNGHQVQGLSNVK